MARLKVIVVRHKSGENILDFSKRIVQNITSELKGRK